MADVLGVGAEGRTTKTTMLGRECVVKERVKKRYRHPTLEALLSKRRLNQEVRCMLRARKCGVATPCIFHVDYEEAKIFMSFIKGKTIKSWLQDQPPQEDVVKHLTEMGRLLGKLHDSDVIHGDLTTSNIILSEDNTLWFIDFGLSYVSSMPEDKAVDLYVMQRALESTHTQQDLTDIILKGYKSSKKQQATLNKLTDVRMRGRKKVMVG
ncbi:hypothetical protein GUITHDRAFT_158207 [Guillardia theta CCMP2712]|uniref:non-specific serine/threonine protein kinase n=2 Tax=Guillardia theta TaxID=55529 RepID=L1IYV2_GUITC|nr:hypothetical protein GUITHDRAFT_158207 [Guillardia theta CCMP2712]EKX41448.1 hypothetical protein GUITHDRAFT_158207 [Guillardia theta CCMP2712]|eukprot:XP_005828428.1 hypothetical protein GUITHDRAFT_158207 [Guillardia theta CCMP2712]